MCSGLTPRRKQVGLFKGELWLDQETALPLREWGDFNKSPSKLLKRTRFVRDYVLDRTRAKLRRLILTARAILAGDVELTVWFGNEVSQSGRATEESAGDQTGSWQPGTEAQPRN